MNKNTVEITQAKQQEFYKESVAEFYEELMSQTNAEGITQEIPGGMLLGIFKGILKKNPWNYYTMNAMLNRLMNSIINKKAIVKIAGGVSRRTARRLSEGISGKILQVIPGFIFSRNTTSILRKISQEFFVESLDELHKKRLHSNKKV